MRNGGADGGGGIANIRRFFWTFPISSRQTWRTQQTLCVCKRLLIQKGVNFNDVLLWQRRGAGLYWRQEAHAGHDPVGGRAVQTTRRRVRVDRELPLGEGYAALIGSLMRQRVLGAEAG